MRLEEEISQPNFKSEHQKMLINIMYTSGWLHNIIAHNLKNYDITPQQFNILRILRGQYPNTARMHLLQERMLDKMSNASRLVERLRYKGLVKRKICIKDRRAVDVVITEQGLQLLKQLDVAESKWQEQFQTIDDSAAKNLNELLDNLRGNTNLNH